MLSRLSPYWLWALLAQGKVMDDTSNPAALIQKLREIHIPTQRDHQ
ncbi:hypothetical protein [Sulfitobacter geojensis]|nr:hypothetical protein [Sulfitobacter geojensis]KHA51435.1 hypothetical protein Z947_1720 [Sulfitobacter geojensis]NYI28858.1 hypothetical protein [Sulfitobacter geojensis]